MEASTTNACGGCGFEGNRAGTRFCGNCGNDMRQTPARVAPQPKSNSSPESVKRFRDFVEQAALDGVDLAEQLESLISDAIDMGIGKHEAMDVLEDVQASLKKTAPGIKLLYDLGIASNGIANGNSLLSFKIDNLSERSIESVQILISHPETQQKIQVPTVKNLAKAQSKSVEAPVFLSLPGQHSIGEGTVRVISLSGAVEVYNLASSIRIHAKGGNVHSTNVYSQSITNNAVATIDLHDTATTKPKSQIQWEAIRLTRINAVQTVKQVDATPESPLPRQASSAPSDPPAPEISHTVQPTVHPTESAAIESPTTEALMGFFGTLSFVSQHCNEHNQRPIHLYRREGYEGDIDPALANKIIALLPPGNTLVALCEEDPESTHSDSGAIKSWRGTASILTNRGVYHCTRTSFYDYSLDTSYPYASWKDLFFRQNIAIHLNFDWPAVWLGTNDQYFIKGSFIDFENSIESFVYFDEFIAPLLHERFETLRDAALYSPE